MGEPIRIITASFAAEQAAKARAAKVEKAIADIPGLEHADPALFAALGVIFAKVEEIYGSGYCAADFNLDELFGKDKWHGRQQQKLSDLFRDLGYEVDYSMSSSSCNERLFLIWKKPKD